MGMKIEPRGKSIASIATDKLKELITKDNKKKNAKIRKELMRRGVSLGE